MFTLDICQLLVENDLLRTMSHTRTPQLVKTIKVISLNLSHSPIDESDRSKLSHHHVLQKWDTDADTANSLRVSLKRVSQASVQSRFSRRTSFKLSTESRNL